MTLSKRLGALESKKPAHPQRVHRIIIPKAGTLDDAIDDYGREKIEIGDRVIARRMVGPPRLEIV